MNKRLRQREFAFTNWGGKRKGAGRKPKGAKAMASHAKREELKARHPVFVTMRLRAGLRSLRANDAHALLEAAFVAASRESFRIVEHSIQASRVGPGGCPPGPPTDPDVRNSRIRLLGLAGSLRAA